MYLIITKCHCIQIHPELIYLSTAIGLTPGGSVILISKTLHVLCSGISAIGQTQYVLLQGAEFIMHDIDQCKISVVPYTNSLVFNGWSFDN